MRASARSAAITHSVPGGAGLRGWLVLACLEACARRWALRRSRRCVVSLIALGWAVALGLGGCGSPGRAPPAAEPQPSVPVSTPAQRPALLDVLAPPAEPSPAAETEQTDQTANLPPLYMTPFGTRLTSFSVEPASVTLPLGHTVFFIAMGIRPDGSKEQRTSATRWTVEGDPIGKVSPIGALKAVAPGVATVVAYDDLSGRTASATVVVPK